MRLSSLLSLFTSNSINIVVVRTVITITPVVIVLNVAVVISVFVIDTMILLLLLFALFRSTYPYRVKLNSIPQSDVAAHSCVCRAAVSLGQRRSYLHTSVLKIGTTCILGALGMCHWKADTETPADARTCSSPPLFYLSVHLSTYPPTYLSIDLSIYLPIHLSTSLSIYRSIFPAISRNTKTICTHLDMCIYIHTHLCTYICIYIYIYMGDRPFGTP